MSIFISFLYLLLFTVVIIINSFFCIYLMNLGNYFKKIYKRKILYNVHSEMLLVYELSKTTAYEYVFQKEIYIHWLSKTKINNKDIGPIQDKFIKMTLDLCGPSVIEDLKALKGGDLKPIILELGLYFINRLTKEEVSLFKNESSDSSPITFYDNNTG